MHEDEVDVEFEREDGADDTGSADAVGVGNDRSKCTVGGW